MTIVNSVIAQVTNVLGETLPVTHTFEDGSYSCPHCDYPIVIGSSNWIVGSCNNPVCSANPSTRAETVIRQRERAAQQERAKANAKSREESIRLTMAARAADHKQWEQEQIAEARRKGCCLRCLFAPGWKRVKFIKHRTTCPKERT